MSFDATEKRKLRPGLPPGAVNPEIIGKSAVPRDYCKMVEDVMTTTFADGLAILGKLRRSPRFDVTGHLFKDEIVLSVTIVSEQAQFSTTVHASTDFDPNASSPKAEDLLAASVDAVGNLFAQFLSPDEPDRIRALADSSLSSLQDIPFEWTEMEVSKRKVFLKVDKSNPRLDQMADEFLKAHEPDAKSVEIQETLADSKKATKH